MNLQEIVAAVIDNVTISTDIARIEASRALGRNVELVSRTTAKQNAVRENSQFWSALATARTIFLSGGGAVYRCRPQF